MLPLFVYLLKAIPYIFDKIAAVTYKSLMYSCGKKVLLRPLTSDFKGIENFHIGNNVSIPKGSCFYSTNASLIIKDNVIFGPNPTIITGDHRIDAIGLPIIYSTDKLPENDADTIIEEDVWTGANVVILKGITIGRGTVIAAGAVVNKSSPPYSIIGGVPAKVLKFRFTIDEVLEHELRLYPDGQRFTREELELSRK